MVEDMHRRLKGILVSPHDIVDLFRQRAVGDVLTYATFPDMPKDAKVVGVNWMPMRVSFLILVTHESFEEVPFGQEVPLLGEWKGTCRRVQVTGTEL